MNKKTLIAIIILVVALVILGAIWIGAKTAKAPEVPAGGGSTSTTTGAGTSSTTASSSSAAKGATSSSASGVLGISIKKFYSNGSFSFNYPVNWSVSQNEPF